MNFTSNLYIIATLVSILFILYCLVKIIFSDTQALDLKLMLGIKTF